MTSLSLFKVNSNSLLLTESLPDNSQLTYFVNYKFPGGSVVNNPPASAEDKGLVSGLERSPGEGNDNPFQYSCQGNSMDRGAWQAIVHGVTKELNTT